jgi:hypothetical protein
VNPLTVTSVAVGELLLPLGTGLLIGASSRPRDDGFLRSSKPAHDCSFSAS